MGAAVDAVNAAANVTIAAAVPTVTVSSTHNNNVVDERFVKKKDKNSRGTHKRNDIPITTKKYKEFRDAPLVAVNAHVHVADDGAVDEKKDDANDNVGVEEELEKLATAEQKYKEGMKEVAVNNKKKLQEQLQQEQQRDRTTPTMRSKSSLYDTPLPPVTITKASIETSLAGKTTDDNDNDTTVEDEYVDDEGDWLRVLHDIGSDTYDEGQYEDEEDDWTGNISKKKNKDQMIGAAVFDTTNDEDDDGDDDEKIGWNPPSGSNSKKSKILGAAVFDNYEEEDEKIGWNPPSGNSQKKKEILGAAVFDNYEEEADEKIGWNPPSGNNNKKKEILGAAVFDNYVEDEATIAWNPPSTNNQKKKEILGAAVFDNDK